MLHMLSLTSEADYEKAADELSRAQLELDAVNQRDTFELEE